MLVDWDAWAVRHTWALAELDRITRAVRDHAQVRAYAEHIAAQGKDFSLRSTPQRQALLYTVLHCPVPPHRTPKGGISTDADALAWILQHTRKGSAVATVLALLLRWASVEQTRKMLEIQAKHIHGDGRLHPRWWAGAHSGRRRSAAPNLQNIPPRKDPADPQNLRSCLVAAPGHVYVVSDYGQLEFRLLACVANDDQMVGACNDGDPHGRLSIRLTLPRRLAKTINFACLYGASWSRIQQEVRTEAGEDWSEAKSRKVIQDIYTMYDDLDRKIHAVHRQVKTLGYVDSVLGHRRLLPQGQSSNDEKVRERACREGWNHHGQSLGHALLERGLELLLKWIDEYDLPWRICNDTHDGCVLEVPVAQQDLAATVVQWLLEEQAPKILPAGFLKVALPVEVKVGPSFGALRPWVPVEEEHAVAAEAVGVAAS